ncbi:hypothetical protein [Thermoanaerobacter italicus]|uniref:hypothetical protein n=1 Tax=Thermoanaerobacter italicus TaxID=108150 RepID=UPI00039F4325|nr:hypothetical protein [Thermoanaerobacter italicus]
MKKSFFDKVNYTVNGRDIFKDFSFSIKKGERIAILGPSGKRKEHACFTYFKRRQTYIR